jgi:hypothetical protein
VDKRRSWISECSRHFTWAKGNVSSFPRSRAGATAGLSSSAVPGQQEGSAESDNAKKAGSPDSSAIGVPQAQEESAEMDGAEITDLLKTRPNDEAPFWQAKYYDFNLDTALG